MAVTEPLSSLLADTAALRAVRKVLSVDKQAFRIFGTEAPRTLLLSGPPGVGKTKAVRIAAQEMSIPVFSVTPGPHVCQALRNAFKSARTTAFDRKARTRGSDCIVFIDEIDAICPSSPSGSLDFTTNTATSLLLSFIGPQIETRRENRQKVSSVIFVIAATNRRSAIHPSLRRAGRFDREEILRPPSVSERLDLLCAIEPNVDREVLRAAAKRALGFVAADLVALCRTARNLDDIVVSAGKETHMEPLPSNYHFNAALGRTTPSVLRSAIAAEAPVASWDDIGGLQGVKRRLKMAVEWPLLYAETFQTLGLKAPRGILLHGPPGCSKTTLVRAAASQSHASFIRLNGADIYSCYLGEAERILRDAFAMARSAAPCVLFLDEIDAIVGKRSMGGSQTDGNGVQERVISTLLTEMDGVVSATGVLVTGATNRVDLLDDALLRPGRFDDIVEVGLPDQASRLEILHIHSMKLPLGDDVNLLNIAEQTEGKSGADLMSMCVEAGLAALREVLVSEDGKHSHAACEESELIVTAKHFNIKQKS